MLRVCILKSYLYVNIVDFSGNNAVLDAGVKDLESPLGGAKRASQAHMLLIHHVQKADAEDAWLQREWGEVLALEKRLPEAARHFQAAGMLLAQRITSLAQGKYPLDALLASETHCVQLRNPRHYWLITSTHLLKARASRMRLLMAHLLLEGAASPGA